jgi:simple sugar transport system permease protein
MALPITLLLEPRLIEAGPAEIALRLATGLVLALALGALIILAAGHDPLVAYGALLRGAFGSWRAVQASLNKAVPIALCALGIALAYRARIWNIGAEGQLYFGAFAAAGVGIGLPDGTPAALAIPLVLLAGMAAGAGWALLAALPRAYLGMNEILSTLMLNYIAILWVSYLVDGPWADPSAFSFPYSRPLIDEARIGRLLGNVHFGVLAMLAGAVLLALLDRGLRFGYELRVAGDAPRAATYAGIPARATIILAMLLAGLLAGLAGAIEVSASIGRLQTGLSPGYGFMAILVAWLAGGRPAAILLVAVLYAGLLNGGFALQVSGIPPAIGTILQAMLLLAALATVNLGRHRLRVVRRPGAAPA